MHQPEEGIGARWPGQPPGQSRASLAAEGEAKLALNARQPCRAARGAGSDGVQRLGKGLTLAMRIAAAEATCADQKNGRAPLPG